MRIYADEFMKLLDENPEKIKSLSKEEFYKIDYKIGYFYNENLFNRVKELLAENIIAIVECSHSIDIIYNNSNDEPTMISFTR